MFMKHFNLRKICFFLILILVTGGSVFSQGFNTTNWKFSNPKQFGFTVLDVDYFDNNNAIAVGSNGGIAKTTDGGLNWTYGVFTYINPASFKVTANFNDVHYVTSTVAYAVGSLGAMAKTTDGGATWNFVATPLLPNTKNINACWFVDVNKGYIGGEQNNTADSLPKLYVTLNGGATWDSIAAPAVNGVSRVGYINNPSIPSVLYPVDAKMKEIFRIEFLNANTGYISGSNSYGVTLFPSVSFRATSAAVCTPLATLLTSGSMGAALLWKFNNGVLTDYSISKERLGYFGINLAPASINCTSTFASITPVTQQYRAMNIYNDSTVVLMSFNNNTVVKVRTGVNDSTANPNAPGVFEKGKFEVLNYPFPPTAGPNAGPPIPNPQVLLASNPYQMRKTSNGTLVVNGNGGRMFKSVDTGRNWIQDVSLPQGQNFSNNGVWAMDIAPNGRILSMGANGVVADSLPGSPWRSNYITTPLSASYNDMEFIDCNNGIAAGGFSITVTNDGGNTWIDRFSPVLQALNANITHLSYVNPTKVYFTTSIGNIYRSANQAVNLSPVFSEPLGGQVNDIAWQGNDSLWACGYSSFSVAAASRQGKVYRSFNNGATWDTIPVGPIGTLSFTPRAMDFPTRSIGYVCGSRNYVFKTTDAGATWTDITPFPALTPQITYTNMQALNKDTIFVVGVGFPRKVVYRTTDGGANWTDITSNILTLGVGNLNGILMHDINNGYVMTPGGALLVTNNGGTSWTLDLAPTQNLFTTAAFVPRSVGPGVNMVNRKMLVSGPNISGAPIMEYGNPANTQVNSTELIAGAACSTPNSGSITITATGGLAPYQYRLNAGPFQNSNVFSGLAAGTYTITIKDAYCGLLTKTVTIALTDDQVLNTNITNATICAGAPVQLIASGNSITYSWSPALGLSNPNIANPIATPLVTTTYTVTATLNSCVKTRSITITVNPNSPLVIVADPGTTLCEGDPTLLTVRDLTGTPAAPVPEILYYKFDGTGTSVPNLASAPPPGSATGTIVGNQTQGGTGQCGTALVGIGGAANANNMNTGWNTNFTGPFTISFWLGANQVDNNPSYLFGNSSAASVFRAFYGGAALTNNMLLRGGSGDILITGVNPAATLVTVVYNGTSTAVYKNGAFFQNYAVTFNTSATAPFLVGGYNSASLSMTGSLDEFRLYNRALSVAEVAQLTNCSTGSTGPISTGTFLWSPALGLSSTTSNPVAASPMNTTTYTVTRTTVPGGCVASANITITVNKRPVVTTQPVSIARCAGTSASFTVGATGTGLTYQWQVSTTGCGGPWVNLGNVAPYSGVNSATLNISAVTGLMNGYGYRCIVSGACSPWIPPTNVSGCAQLTVNPLPVVAISPVGPVCGGVAGISGTQLSVGSTPPPVPGAVTVSSGTINLAVPDNTANGVNHSITVAGVPANATITNVLVSLNMPHTYPADMVFNLRGPSGQILNLYKHNTNTDNGAASIPTAGFYNAVVSGTATTQFVSVPTPFRYGQTAPAGPYKPDALNGVTNPGYTIMDPTGFVSNASTFGNLYTTSTNGNWTLAMCDGGPGDFGTLASWAVTVEYTTPGTSNSTLSYVWSPLAGLYNDAGATSVYTGTNAIAVYAAPTTLTTYTVTATNTVTGCVSTASVLVNYTPPAPSVTPSSVAMCLGDPAVRLVSSSSTTTTLSASSGTIAVVVPDGTGVAATSSLNIAGVPAGSTLGEIKVTLNMNHTWVGDMDINLVAPNNQILNLVGSLNGGTGSNGTANFTNTSFSSLGGATISGAAAPRTGTYAAEARAGYGPTGFIQTVNNWTALAPTPVSANGTWRLAMGDFGGGDVGTLTSWSINVSYVVGVPSTAATWSPVGGLFINGGANPYTGDARDTVWTRPTPAGVYTYQATVQSLPAFLPIPPSFTNPAGITITNGGSTPYPSNLAVSGLPTTGVTVQSVILNGVSHTWSDDVDILLQSPTGVNVILMSDVGGASAITNATYTFSDAGAAMGTGANPTGTYKPTNLVGTLGIEPDNWPAPGPGSVAQTAPALSLFTGNMNGTWKLFVVDDFAGDDGSISGGYTIRFNVPIAPCTSPARTVVVTVNTPTSVTTQPVNQTVCTDKVATFTVVAGGSGPFSYQWQVSTDGGNTYSNITNGGVYSGATTATLTITAPPVSMNNYFYRAVVTGAAPCASATSGQARLLVNPLPVIAITPTYSALFPGMTTTLASTVTPNAAVSYTWIRDGVTLSSGSAGVLSGIGTGTLKVDVDGMGVYSLRVTDVNGCTNTSNSAVVKDSASGRCFIYPNPSSGQFQVRYYSVASNNNLPRGIVVYDAKGDRVKVQNYTIGRPYDRMDVDMRAYGKGLYWVEIVDRNGNRLTMCRVVIQ
jgi:subtilisin-like proprotein convertase family protein/photosystem II stability/assembly factor-like uncharacterized protein